MTHNPRQPGDPWVLIGVRDRNGDTRVTRYNTLTHETQSVEDDQQVRDLFAAAESDLADLPTSSALDELAAASLEAGDPTVRRVTVSDGVTRGISERS